jgi:hypothetical protein
MRERKPTSFLAGRSYRKLLRLTAAFTESLRREPEFAEAIRADLRRFRGDLLRAVRAQLRLRRGRPTDPLLDSACALLKQGKAVAEVLRSQIPGFATLDPYTKYLAEKGLRQAAARRVKPLNRPINRRRKSGLKNAHHNREQK